MIKYLFHVAFFSLILVILSGCASICETRSISKDIGGITVVLPKSSIPCDKVVDYELAANHAIEVVFSTEFKSKLSDFMETQLDEGKHVNAWEGLAVEDIVSSMRAEISGTHSTTYGGIIGWFKYKFAGNIAYDGGSSGPIRLNRWPLKNRTVPQITNSIVHEVSHRAGYTHPSRSKSETIGNLEPAYVIGNLAEEVVLERLSSN